MKYLYDNSGHNPTLDMIDQALPDVDKGEIRDCLLKLKREGLVYCEMAGNMNCEYTDEGKFLITFDGKFFWEEEKGFENRSIRQISQQKQIESLQKAQLQHDSKLGNLTFWVAAGTCAGGVYYVVELLKELYKY